ncbi:hypothetical protein PMI07_000808 [Rhizobium sp. CF080]|uniref:hypothetical protein n=1 Tax=Rhizobium sp. (strain CF080) TaxID=1144310 RepID=UPI000271D60E|nr:hypothetical protein [Rhizobium sp. CF080]EUB97232.1 hypothetical protein PMI07_000808 [Rhizobium sp. CF080]
MTERYCANGHLMVILGGANCGCYPDAACSIPVYSCRECGDSDYGDNDHAKLHREMCKDARECNSHGFDYASLPPLHLTKAEFEALPEYSATLPTGTTGGKRWRRQDGAYDRRCEKPTWIVGEFEAKDFGDQKNIRINWFVPVLKMDAPLTGV